MLATRLSTFVSVAAHMLPLQWSGQEWQRELPAFQNIPVLIAPPLLPIWFTHLHFLPGQSAFYVWLINLINQHSYLVNSINTLITTSVNSLGLHVVNFSLTIALFFQQSVSSLCKFIS